LSKVESLQQKLKDALEESCCRMFENNLKTASDALKAMLNVKKATKADKDKYDAAFVKFQSAVGTLATFKDKIKDTADLNLKEVLPLKMASALAESTKKLCDLSEILQLAGACKTSLCVSSDSDFSGTALSSVAGIRSHPGIALLQQVLADKKDIGTVFDLLATSLAEKAKSKLSKDISSFKTFVFAVADESKTPEVVFDKTLTGHSDNG
jgi:hypothetical protein